MEKDRRKEPKCPYCSGPLEEDEDGFYVFVFCRACSIITGGYAKKRRSDYDSNSDKS